jgi:hypothetical protein
MVRGWRGLDRVEGFIGRLADGRLRQGGRSVICRKDGRVFSGPKSAPEVHPADVVLDAAAPEELEGRLVPVLVVLGDDGVLPGG